MARKKAAPDKARVKDVFDPRNFITEDPEDTSEVEESGEEEGGESDEGVPEVEIQAGTAMEIYLRVPEYMRKAKGFLRDEGKLEEYIQESAMVLMQMERDQALLIPTTRAEVAAAIKARYNFVQRATELLELINSNRESRIRENEQRLEMHEAGLAEV